VTWLLRMEWLVRWTGVVCRVWSVSVSSRLFYGPTGFLQHGGGGGDGHTWVSWGVVSLVVSGYISSGGWWSILVIFVSLRVIAAWTCFDVFRSLF